MGVVLITGMAGTGKSAALAELARRGHRVVDTDYGDWIEDVRLPDGSVEPLWDEERIDALLSGHSDGALFVVGTVANQGKFYPRFDAVVLLSAPLDVILERVATRGRTTMARRRSTARRSRATWRCSSRCYGPGRLWRSIRGGR